MKFKNSLWCLLAVLPTFAAAEQTITLTYENADSYPFAMTDGSGLNLILLRMADEALPEVSFKYEQVPWQRCLNNIETGTTEGCFTASFKEERLKHGYYPGTLDGGKDDPSLALHNSSYSLYVLKDSPISVTGAMKIEGLTGKIAVPAGYSIGDDLTKAGYEIDSTAAKTFQNFQKLANGRVAAVAALTPDGENMLNKNPEFSSKIKVLPTPLVDKPYYLMFSKQFVQSNRALAEKIWATLAELRESQAYKDEAGAYLAK